MRIYYTFVRLSVWFSMIHTLFIDKVHPLIMEEFGAMGWLCDHFPAYGRAEFLGIADRYEGIIIRSKIKIDREFIDQAKNLKFIGRVGAGMENIDVAYAESHGIKCLNSPEGNRDAVAEHALGMLLAIMNNFRRADREVRNGQWIREGNRGTEISGKTIGIIGYGNMGSAFAQRLKGFDARVIAYDKYKSGYSDMYVQETTMQELFHHSDILSLHVPLTTETTRMVDKQFLGQFRKPLWLVNTSRGKVVVMSALAEMIRTGKVLGAALDVLEYEDNSFEMLEGVFPDELSFLMDSDKVLFTPHIAGWTHESNIKLATVLVEKIRRLNL